VDDESDDDDEDATVVVVVVVVVVVSFLAWPRDVCRPSTREANRLVAAAATVDASRDDDGFDDGCVIARRLHFRSSRTHRRDVNQGPKKQGGATSRESTRRRRDANRKYGKNQS
jgi:hypothetical protein